MDYNYFVAPGSILKEYLETKGIKQKQLANKINSSERHVSNIINGRTKLSFKFALKLEEVFPDRKAEYWLNLEREYRLFLLRNKDKEPLKNKEIVDKYRLKSVFKGLNYNNKQMVDELLKITSEQNIESLENSIKECKSLFMHDSGNENTTYLWLKLCEEQIDLQNDFENLPNYNYEKFVSELNIIKKLLNTTNYVLAITNVRRFLNSNGIGLVIEDAIPTAKVRGATTMYEGHPMIYLSTRHKRIDSMYFALIHEVFHIINKDYENTNNYEISYEEDETEERANTETREFFIDKDTYQEFVKNQENFASKENITIFARKNGIVVDLLVGFLQRDEYIKHSMFNDLRTYISEGSDFNVYTNI